MLKRLVIVFSIIAMVCILQSCQHIFEKKEKIAIHDQKIKEAATYNMQLGIAYLNQGNRTRAKQKLLTALQQAPHSAEVNGAMAYFLEKTGNKTEAHAFYKKALTLAPNSGPQLNNYGVFLCREGHYKEAEQYFLKAVKDVQYLHSAGAYENAGICALAIPDEGKAKIYFKRALEQDPHQKQSLIELAKIELKENNPEKALFDLQQYPEITLNDAMLLELAREASHLTGKTKAEADYKQRLSLLNHKTDNAGEENEYDSVIE